MKIRCWIGLSLCGIYAALYALAATSAEPMSVLFVDGINTLIVTAVEEITETYNIGMLPFPCDFALGMIEWFAIGAYVLPGIGKCFAWIFFRRKPSGTGRSFSNQGGSARPE